MLEGSCRRRSRHTRCHATVKRSTRSPSWRRAPPTVPVSVTRPDLFQLKLMMSSPAMTSSVMLTAPERSYGVGQVSPSRSPSFPNASVAVTLAWTRAAERQSAAGHVDAERAAGGFTGVVYVTLMVSVTIGAVRDTGAELAGHRDGLSRLVGIDDIVVGDRIDDDPRLDGRIDGVGLARGQRRRGELPRSSVVATLTSTVVSGSAARSLPFTLMLKAPPDTVPV